MKELFMGLQEQVYKKLRNLGVSQKTIFDFEQLFIDKQERGSDLFDFSEKMAGYAMTIYTLSETTGYEREYLWNIWQEHVQDFFNGDAAYDTLEEEWESFKGITREKDW